MSSELYSKKKNKKLIKLPKMLEKQMKEKIMNTPQ